ncbi:MAG: undecaprenyldiphospho-muramoylpentapeptide beta-N-acetylglucosaminyltransferase [Rhodospirillaceae bacterium]|nr:undecaprenyldiphospho-muramoylpentapeptide beta-N-acetylglucosaminyltransferase [Rhodospirillaceae bacterium]
MSGPAMSGRTNNGTIVLAAGGTGGHVFPAQALAEVLVARGHKVALVTDRRGAAFELPNGEIELHRIRAASPSRRGIWAKAQAALELGLGTLQAYALLRRMRPSAVVGFGGYPSVPTILAASRLSIPTVLHEQNALLGRANRMLAGSAAQIATSFPETGGISPNDRKKAHLTGNPVRPAIAALADTAYVAPGEGEQLVVLITGGSQGANVFADIMPAALAELPEETRARVSIMQQCRPEDLERVASAYHDLGVDAETAQFFTDMPERLTRAHLVICRSGASTVTELAAAGRPAILVPYPHAADDHQTLNARAMERAGGAWLVPEDAFQPDCVASRLETVLNLPASLTEAAAAAKGLGAPDAVDRLADLVLEAARAEANDRTQTTQTEPPLDDRIARRTAA